MARVGLIQTRGIGDIIIALPIATAFTDRGDTVYWPIDAASLPAFQRAAPWINFIPVPSELEQSNPEEYFLRAPERELRARHCETIHMLYSRVAIEGARVQNEKFAAFFKFDEYKYAVTGTPFREKWSLRIKRDMDREMRLFDSLGVRRPYICMHTGASNVTASITIPPDWSRDYDLIQITPRTDSPFDWIHTLEHAAKLVFVESCFSNLVEQLNLPNEKYLVLRHPGAFMPVLQNGWTFL